MFRAAFPTATEQDEKRESSWVKENYSLNGFNGSSKDPGVTRLAGVWVSPEIALQLAESYSLRNIVLTIANATPDPNGNYRRSGKTAGNPSPKPSPAPVVPPTKSLPSPPTHVPNPPKRRKEASPALLSAPNSTRAISPAPASPPPRRSVRIKSPTPKPPSTRQTARVVKTRVEQVVVAESLTDTIMEEPDAAADVASQALHEQDIAEQKAMIADLKSKRDAGMKFGEGDESSNLKRSREEDEPMTFDFKEPEVGERQIATNRKISRFQMQPKTKAVAWGVAAFAFGLGAVYVFLLCPQRTTDCIYIRSLLPNFM